MLRTISQVSREMGVSTRMLRYYEQAGLIRSLRRPDYAYRIYDGEALQRLRLILVLRKLRVPVRQIGRILARQDAATAIDVFRQSADELGAEIDALKLVRSVLNRLMELIGREPGVRLNPLLLEDASVAGLIAALSPPDQLVKGDRTMDALNRADQKLSALKDVRIVYLPPSWVAACHYRGEDSEAHAQEVVNRFALDSGLLDAKPDVRHFGFNNPAQDAAYNTSSPGYEMWVTIPDGFSVPAPLTKKRFLGGLYAAHAIEFGQFDHWGLLYDWVVNSPDHAPDFEPRCEPSDPEMDRCLEEQLNYLNNVRDPAFDVQRMQLDLLLPVR